MRLRWLFSLPIIPALLFLPGCHRDEVRRYRIPKTAQGMAPTAVHPTVDMPADEVPPPPALKGTLKWTTPKGWTQEGGGGMRYATLKPTTPGRIDISVVVLPGPAGGELANVNRWRGQIGLPPIDEQTLAGQRRVVKTKAGGVAVFDFTSQGEKKSRMIVGLLTTPDGSTWFLKMTGDEGPVANARATFMQWIGSLRLD